MPDFERWSALWHRLGAASDPTLSFDRLTRQYAEAQRFYHTLAHIGVCLAELDRAEHLAEAPDEVEVALWLHDVVYDPRAWDNEERSADWARDALAQGGIAADVRTRVAELILATKHVATPGAPDAALTVDIDLAILGHSPQEFEAYETAIRREYAWVPEPVFRRTRSGILRSLLGRARIYATDWFGARYESRARENLRQGLRRLAP